jgi:hypothetical protein
VAEAASAGRELGPGGLGVGGTGACVISERHTAVQSLHGCEHVSPTSALSLSVLCVCSAVDGAAAAVSNALWGSDVPRARSVSVKNASGT